VLFLFLSFLTDHYFQFKRSRKLRLAALLRKWLNYYHTIFGYNKGLTHLMMESGGHWRSNVALTNFGSLQVPSLSLALLALLLLFFSDALCTPLLK
jgi:hypothetical protein